MTTSYSIDIILINTQFKNAQQQKNTVQLATLVPKWVSKGSIISKHFPNNLFIVKIRIPGCNACLLKWDDSQEWKNYWGIEPETEK